MMSRGASLSLHLTNKDAHDLHRYATRGLRALAVAYEELDGNDFEAEGNGCVWCLSSYDVGMGAEDRSFARFELIGLLPIFDPPRSDTKQTIDDALALGVKVKIVTGDQVRFSSSCPS
jgi:H+-transporting ATPase